MIANASHMGLTADQHIKDMSFVRSIRSVLIPGILKELCGVYPGFETMNARQRMCCLIKENDEYVGKGDFLALEYGLIRFYAYSGIRLGNYEIADDVDLGAGEVDKNETRWYVSLFDNLTTNDEGRRALFDETTLGFRNAVRDSPLGDYLHARTRNELPIWLSTVPRLYEELPVAYRVALVCQHINENVIATPDAITAFVLGVTKDLDTHRYLAEPRINAQGLNSGWTVRLRDVRPSQELGRRLAAFLRNLVVRSEEQEQATKRKYSQFEERPQSKRRATNERVAAKIAFVDDLLDAGYVIGGRGSGKGSSEKHLSWEQAAGMLAAKHGIACTGKQLQDCWSRYKKRHACDDEG